MVNLKKRIEEVKEEQTKRENEQSPGKIMGGINLKKEIEKAKEEQRKEKIKEATSEKYEPEKHFEEICKKNKLSVDATGYNKVCSLGLLNLLNDKLLSFVQTGKESDVLIVKKIGVQVNCEKTKEEVSSEILEILNNPNFLELIDEELEKKIVGEHEARKTIFMVENMRNVENLNKATDNLMINAISGAGKDHIVEAEFELIPESEKEELIRTTPKVLAYTRNRKIEPLSSWKKTTLRLEDASNEVLNDDSFKVFSSANPNKINMGKVVNKGKIIEIEIEGKPSIIMTLAEANPREELLRRFPICPLDEGIDQTKEILKRQSLSAITGKNIEYDERIKNAIRMLKRIKVKVPFAEKLVKIFNPENVIVRTHFPRFLDYIKSSCSLHQFQRQKDEEGYFIAEKQDYQIARLMLQKTTSNILMIPLDKTKRTILLVFEKYDLQKKSVDDLQDIEEIKKINIDIEWLRRQLKWLTSKGFLSQDKEKRIDESGRTIPKPVHIFSYNKMHSLEVPLWEELDNISSFTSDKDLTSNSPNSSNTGVNEVNEQFEQKRKIRAEELNFEDSVIKEPNTSEKTQIEIEIPEIKKINDDGVDFPEFKPEEKEK